MFTFINRLSFMQSMHVLNSYSQRNIIIYKGKNVNFHANWLKMYIVCYLDTSIADVKMFMCLKRHNFAIVRKVLNRFTNSNTRNHIQGTSMNIEIFEITIIHCLCISLSMDYIQNNSD